MRSKVLSTPVFLICVADTIGACSDYFEHAQVAIYMADVLRNECGLLDVEDHQFLQFAVLVLFVLIALRIPKVVSPLPIAACL